MTFMDAFDIILLLRNMIWSFRKHWSRTAESAESVSMHFWEIWPRNDHGAQVIGYRISILLDPKPNEPWRKDAKMETQG